MDQIQAAVQYLAQCDAETRDALVAIAHKVEGIVLAKIDPPNDHSAVGALVALRSDPMGVATGLMALANGKKRGRPVGSKRKAKAE